MTEPWEVLAVRYGTMRTTKGELFYRYQAYGDPDGPADIDYYFWVLRRGQTTLVVDTGFDPDVGARRGRTCLCPPREALARLGIEPASVSRVLVTHCHYDHIGNLEAFPQADLLVPEAELAFWTSERARHVQFWSHVEEQEIAQLAAAHADGRARLYAGERELAPGLTAIPVGGHSPGQQILLVETERGLVVLTSDAVHFYEELELDRPFAVIVDLEEMYAAFELVRRLARERGAVLVPGHDPAVAARFPSVGGEADGIAVRVA